VPKLLRISVASRLRVLLCGLALLPAPRSAGAACVGDCDADGAVTVSEVVRLVGVALGLAGIDECPAGDADGDGQVTIAELVAVVGNALAGCGPAVNGPWVQGDPGIRASTCTPEVDSLVQRTIDAGGFDCVYDLQPDGTTLREACGEQSVLRPATVDQAGRVQSTVTTEQTVESCRITTTEALSADLRATPTAARRVLDLRFTPACRRVDCALRVDATWALPPPLVGLPVYVTDVDGGAVWIIDSGSRAVAGPPIAVGAGPMGLAATPDGRHVYVANQHADSLSVIALGVRTRRNTIAVGPRPTGIAITPDGTRAYVAAQGNFASTGQVSVVSTASRQRIQQVASPGATDLAIAPDGARVYVVNQRSPGVLRVRDTTIDAWIEPDIPIGGTPTAVALAPDGQRAYVAAFDSVNGGWIAVVDTAAGAVVGTRIPVGFTPQDVAVTPDGTRVLVANRDDDSVSIIAAASDAVVATVPVGGGPLALAVTPDGREAWVANGAGRSVSVIDLEAAAAVETIPLDAFPAGIAIGRALEIGFPSP
jgi:YVTN family beta-propeller protein